VPGVITGVGVAVATLLIARWYLGHIRVEIGPGELSYTGLGRTRRWPRTEIAKLLVVDGMVDPGTGEAWLIALDARGRRLFNLTTQAWTRAGFDQIATSLDGPTERYPMGTSMKELNATYPKAFNFVQLHPVLAVAALCLLVTLAVGLAVALL
jgi:hypothetical protein